MLNTPSHQLDASKQGGGEIMNTWHGSRPSDQSDQNEQDNEDSESAKAEVGIFRDKIEKTPLLRDYHKNEKPKMSI